MKISSPLVLTLFVSLTISFTLLGCNATKPKTLDNAAHQQANTSSKFPSTSRVSGTDITCYTCRASFKVTQAMQKNGNNAIICPHCKHNYSNGK
ncbi:MAG: Unknown protein [uncultured Sulfurovum sp.]|uniref:Zinc finger/thioredoxin putative domain-containing protein n=1 Tax=uncultured Sulfurovum sp. TaxID=269237 RepID=A0A6S6SAX9_9BACT|nr:MAG: Unknown protein [uncultured Sulfurovum sp.]